jgi:hypothetical protein
MLASLDHQCCVVNQNKMEDPKADEVPEPDPAAFIEFKSHEQAISALRQVGFVGADKTPSFTPDGRSDSWRSC